MSLLRFPEHILQLLPLLSGNNNRGDPLPIAHSGNLIPHALSPNFPILNLLLQRSNLPMFVIEHVSKPEVLLVECFQFRFPLVLQPLHFLPHALHFIIHADDVVVGVVEEGGLLGFGEFLDAVVLAHLALQFVDFQFQLAVLHARAFVELLGEGGLRVDRLVVAQRLVLRLLAPPQRFSFGLQFFQLPFEEDQLVFLVFDLYDLVFCEGGADGLDFLLEAGDLFELCVLFSLVLGSQLVFLGEEVVVVVGVLFDEGGDEGFQSVDFLVEAAVLVDQAQAGTADGEVAEI